jgi:hypothetical protein
MLDAFPWYTPTVEALAYARAEFGALGYRVITPEEVRERLRELIRSVLSADTALVLPLMSGGLVYDVAKEETERASADLVLLPLSKHPFVTLTADAAAQFAASMARYERMNRAWVPLGGDATAQRSNIVLLDTNTARGADAFVFRERSDLSHEQRFAFISMINEEKFDAPGYAPGWRSGPKYAAPSHYMLKTDTSTRYLSHLRYLTLPLEGQIGIARRVRSRYPHLTQFWDTTPADLRYVHNHESSNNVIHKERTHARFAEGDAQLVAEIERIVMKAEELGMWAFDRAASDRREALLSASSTTWGVR